MQRWLAKELLTGRLVLKEIDRLVEERVDFTFESTLSGVGYVARLRDMKDSGYHIEIIYLKIVSARLAMSRIKSRVQQGGHSVPSSDIRRRFVRSWKNFEKYYRPLADAWAIYDNSTRPPKLIGSGP